MMDKIICVCLSMLVVIHASKFDRSTSDCKSCDGKVKDKHVCGEDGNTYMSMCHMEEAECVLKKTIGFKCNGECPCDPEEVLELDEETVLALSSFRKQVQMDQYKDAIKNMEDQTKGFSFDILDKDKEDDDNSNDDVTLPTKKPITVKLNVKAILNVNTTHVNKMRKKSKLRPTTLCPVIEMQNIPNRLVDWFHVLKTNERRKMFMEQNKPSKVVLREMSFVEAKLKSLYSQLACSLQEDDGQEICYTPVKWMFEHLDADGDKSLTDEELLEIEEINSEHCIKPFLQHCDEDGNGEVRLKEFCKCLCVEPPCTKMMRYVPANVTTDGAPVVASNTTFAPKCDEDGFFMPTQCHGDECWCADRNGAEYIGTRSGDKKPACDDNTELHAMNLKTKPLDYMRENKKSSIKI